MKKHPWRDYNGPSKPITDQQMEELLKLYFDIKPRADGQYHREDFEAAFAHYLDGKKTS